MAELVLISYSFLENKKQDFSSFYQSKLKPWLEKQGVKDVRCWIVGDRLILIVSPVSPPDWIGGNGIPEFGLYVDGATKTEVNLKGLFGLDLAAIQRLPDLHFE